MNLFAYRITRISAAIFVAAAAVLLPARPAACTEKSALVVVVNKANPVGQLSLTELREIFLCNRQSWGDGGKIVALQLPAEAPQRAAFEQLVFGMGSSEVAQMWVDRRIRGLGAEPTSVPSVVLLQRLVSKTAGAISYVRLDQVTDQVKVVRIDGKTPEDAAYPLIASIEGRN